MSELVSWFSFRKFWPQRCTTLWTPNWSWRRQNKSNTKQRHLKQLGYVNELDIWVPHKLNEIQLTKRISICDLLLKRNETDPLLKRIITGDEKWIVYDNVVRKRSWSKRDEPAQSTLKADIHERKVMLSFWWDFKGIVYFELVPRKQTINSDVYCRQLIKLDKEIEEKRPKLATRKGVIFHRVNARLHTYIFGHVQKIIEVRLGSDASSHLILIKKHSIQMRLSKMSWFSFLPLKTKLSTKAELWSWLRDGKRSSNKMVNT